VATIQKILNTNNLSYRVFIRKQGLKALSKTFPTKKLAKEFALGMESDISTMMLIRGKSSNTLFKHLVDEYLASEQRYSELQLLQLMKVQEKNMLKQTVSKCKT